MKHYRSLLLLPFVLTGCATTDMQGALDSLNGLGHSIGTSLSQAVDFRAILTPVFHPILTPPVGV